MADDARDDDVKQPPRGVRFSLERPRDPTTGPWRYEGEAVLDEGSFAVVAHVDAAGAVKVESGAPPAVAEKIRLVLRTAFRQLDDGDAPPRMIRRWRAL